MSYLPGKLFCSYMYATADLTMLTFFRVVRASLGAMSTTQEVDTFLSFLHSTFVEKEERRHHRVSPLHVVDVEMEREPAYSTG